MTRVDSASAFVFSVACLLLSAHLGCGGPTSRAAVSGTVTHGGQPLADGTILFEPLGAGSRQANGVILDGRYQIEREFGLAPGAYRVVIQGYRVVQNAGSAGPLYQDAAGDETAIREPFLPDEFNRQTKLRAEVESVRPQVFDFQL